MKNALIVGSSFSVVVTPVECLKVSSKKIKSSTDFVCMRSESPQVCQKLVNCFKKAFLLGLD